MSAGQVVAIYEQNQAWVNPVGNEGNQNATWCPSPSLAFFGCSTRSEAEMVKIVSVGSGTITIAAPGLSQTYSSGLTPQVFYWSTTGPTSSDGIRNIKIDAGDGSGGHAASDFAVAFVFCNQCYAQNIAVIHGHRAGIYGLFTYQDEFRDSYVSESNTAGAPTEYGIECDRCSLAKIENNILFGITSPVVLEANYGTVVGYNYTLNTATDNLFPTLDTHLSHNYLILMEGNSTSNIDWDFVHGSASHDTAFRNFLWGNNPNKTNYRTPYNADAYQRYNNIIGNVEGDPTIHTQYECTLSNPQGSDNFIYGLGWNNGCFAGSGSYDATTTSSVMRWGNWDAVTYCTNGGHGGTACGSTGSNGIRFCTGSGAGNAACTASETASTDPTFPGLSSPSTTLPASFYNGSTSAHASCGTGLTFWKNPSSGFCPQYPSIGPDVSGSTNVINNTASHAVQIPAQLCYNATSKTSGFLTNYDAAACYANDPASPPTVTSITVLPNPAAVLTTTTVNMQTSSFCTFTDLSTVAAGSAGCVVTWTDTNTHSSVNSSTGVVTGITAGSDTITATLGAVSGTATVNVSSKTWYIRPDGGTRWTAAHSTGQCNGNYDVAYPGSGTNQNCAFNDPRWLWDDQTFGNYPNWAITGGDTVILRANTAGAPWRVGFQGNGSSTDVWCFGGSGPFACGMPGIPSGTAGGHTRFLGENFAACNTTRTIVTVSGPRVQAIPDVSKTTKIFGGHGVFAVVNDAASQYVDVQCLDISSFTPSCQLQGSPSTNPCQTSIPLSDYVSDGLVTSKTSGNLLIQDIYIHGTNSRGIHGEQGTGPVIGNRVWISITPQTGWDFDDGQPSGTGAFTLTNSIIECSGCQQVNSPSNYPPLSDAQLWQDVNNAFSQGSGGVIGDALGTPPVSGFPVTMDSNVFQWNTQDGPDFGHMDTGSFPFTATNNVSQHNMGQVFKVGWAFSTVNLQNNITMADCARMQAGNQLPGGVSSTLNQYLVDPCRAGDNWSINFNHSTNMLLANNTIVGYQPTFFDYKCVDGSNDCSAAVWNINNNIVMAYVNPAVNSGIAPADFCGPSCNGPPFTTIGTINRKNNIYYNLRACHANVVTPDAAAGTSTGEACTSPLFASQPTSPMASYDSLDGFNYNVFTGSPAALGGVSYAGILANDYAGNAITTPPVIGALNPSGSSPTVATPTATPSAGTYTSTQIVSLATSTLGAVICYTVDGSTPTATAPGTCSNGISYFTNLQNTAGGGTWVACFLPSCNPGGSTPSGTPTVTFGSTALSSDSLIMTVAGANANLLGYRHLGCPNGSCTAITGMTEDEDFYIPSSTTHLQALEFDPDIYTGTHKYFASMQCDSASGKWRFWNTATDSWTVLNSSGGVIPTYNCTVLAATNSTHHFHLEVSFNTTAHTYTYNTLTLDGTPVYSGIGNTYSALADSGTATVNIEQQIDNDGSAGTNVVYYGNLALQMAATPITIATTTTVKALGTLAAATNSGVGSFLYTITALPVVATPTASPASGTYTSTQSVTLSTATGGATICYTIDGSTPTAPVAGTCSGGSTLTYGGAISVSSTTTVKALGTKSGDTNSNVASFGYTINLPLPPASVTMTGTIKLSGTVVVK